MTPPCPVLVTEFGRQDRAAVMGRARDLLTTGLTWQQAMAAARREAAAQLSPANSIAIRKEETHV